jgi:hypothetical protein
MNSFWLRTVLLVLLPGILLSQTPPNVPTNGLVAFYPLNGNLSNSLSSAHQGSLLNAIPASDRNNLPNRAYFLNGTNASLLIPSTVMQQVTSDFTVSIWLKPDTIGRGTVPTELISDKNAGGWLHKFRIGLGAIATGYPADSACFDAIVTSAFIPKVTLPYPPSETWTHLAIVYSSLNGGTFKAYYNGLLFSSLTGTGFVSGARQINVGRAIFPGNSSGGFFFKGWVDDIGIWNRELSATEIETLAGCVISSNPPPVVSATAGDSTQISLSPAAASTFYQWQVQVGGVFVNLNNGPNIAGANGPTLTLRNLQYAQNGSLYRCLMNDTLNNCNGPSTASMLQVICPVQISTQPQNSINFAGGNANFTVVSSAGATFQWQRRFNNIFVNLSNIGQFSGTNTNTLLVTGVQFGNNGDQFRCIVGNPQFSCADTTQIVNLQVVCQPNISFQPQSQLVTVLSSAVFNVSTSAPNASYQWQQMSGNIGINISNGVLYSGVNSANLTVNGATRADDGKLFRCIITVDGCQDTSDIATLFVQCPNLITTQPNDVTVPAGQAAIFTVNLIPAATYQWYKLSGLNLTPLADNLQISGSNAHQLVINNIDSALNNSFYACIVNQGGCIDTSDVARLLLGNNTNVAVINKGTIKLFPNPTQDWLNIKLPDFMSAEYLHVYDAQGREIFSQNLSNVSPTIRLDVANWPNGLYNLRLGTITGRFIIQR